MMEIIESIVAITLLTILSLMFITGFIYLMTGLFKWFYHDVLEWHLPISESERFKGISNCAVCKHCGKRIMQDSQGNWFRYD